jgi:hypothetical protein
MCVVIQYQQVIPDEFRGASPTAFVVETLSVNKFNNLAFQWTFCVSVSLSHERLRVCW